MYNEEIKSEFIKESIGDNPQLEVILPRIFRYAEKIEHEKNRDISNWGIKDIISYYKSLCIGSVDSLKVMNSQLRRYTEFCQYKNLLLDNQNHFNEITYDILLTCVNKGLIYNSIVTKKDLYEYIDEMNIVADAFLSLALFEGIGGSKLIDFNKLTLSDFEGNKVKLESGRTLKVSNKLLALAVESSNTYYFKTNARLVRYKDNDKRIIKDKANSFSDEQRLVRYQHQLIRLRKSTGNKFFSASTLNESGRIDMIMNLSKEHGMSYEEILSDEKLRNVIEYRYGKIYSLSRYLKKYDFMFKEGNI